MDANHIIADQLTSCFCECCEGAHQHIACLIKQVEELTKKNAELTKRLEPEQLEPEPEQIPDWVGMSERFGLSIEDCQWAVANSSDYGQ
tara:strand:+ start:163 stop:429 length:267 start_codon:yes stop_codon:yes gene_type:complete